MKITAGIKKMLRNLSQLPREIQGEILVFLPYLTLKTLAQIPELKLEWLLSHEETALRLWQRKCLWEWQVDRPRLQ